VKFFAPAASIFKNQSSASGPPSKVFDPGFGLSDLELPSQVGFLVDCATSATTL
jgi:hypothetical protein